MTTNAHSRFSPVINKPSSSSLIILSWGHHIGGISTLRSLIIDMFNSDESIYIKDILVSFRTFQSFLDLALYSCNKTTFLIMNLGVWENYLVILLLLMFRRRALLSPAFHPPKYVKHKLKSHVARIVTNLFGILGLELLVHTNFERANFPLCKCIVYPLLPKKVSFSTPNTPREYDFVFLGRPTPQKGFNKFINMARLMPTHHFLSLAAYDPKISGSIPDNCRIIVEASDIDVLNYLHSSKVLLLPSDYESLGYAQLEAIQAGCIVPLLGKWPFWEQFDVFCGDLDMSAHFLAGSDLILNESRLVDRLKNLVGSYPDNVLNIQSAIGSYLFLHNDMDHDRLKRKVFAS